MELILVFRNPKSWTLVQLTQWIELSELLYFKENSADSHGNILCSWDAKETLGMNFSPCSRKWVVVCVGATK